MLVPLMRKIRDISVDGGSFIIVDPAYLDIISAHTHDLGAIKKAVEEWHGYMAQWGDGDYPLYEVLDESGDIVGVLILMDKSGAIGDTDANI